jgi:uncharacterized phage protein gp47/JayE
MGDVMAWATPLFEAMFDEAKAVYKAIRTNAASTRLSDLWVRARTWAHLFRGAHEHIDVGLARFFPTTTSGSWLDKWLYFVGAADGQGSYGLIKPHISEGTDALRVTCTAGAPQINPTHELLDDVGNRYRINETYNFPGAGTYDADIVSIDTGLPVNLETGDTLEFVSPPAGIQSTATLVADLDFGRAKETDENGRARLLDKMQTPPMGGNWPDMVETIEESISGTLDAWTWAGRQNQPYGWGTVDYVATQRGEASTDRETTAAQQAIVEAAIEDEQPSLIYRNARYLNITPVYKTLVVEYKLVDGASASQQCDWDAEANRSQITAQDTVKKMITVNPAYGAGVLEVGDRVFIAGLEAVVSVQPGDGVDPDIGGSFAKFKVEAWPWTVNLATGGPAGAGFYVCSGGGIVVTVYTGVAAYLDGIDGDSPDGRGNLPKLGPAKGDYADPLPAWDDTIRLDFVKSAAAIAAQGAIVSFTTCTIGGAAADAGPTYDATDAVDLMMYDEIQVYEDKT